LAGGPRPVRIDVPGKAAVHVIVTIDHVVWKCRVARGNSRGTVAIEFDARCGVSLEYRSLEEYVRGLAASGSWATEELAARIACDVADAVGSPVVVAIEHGETADTAVRVVASCEPREPCGGRGDPPLRL